jgi:L-ascorbate metabolism protein UlaG (beta-lactamase superfamily)
MKITKLGHSCLLVEMPERTALFDPGVYSQIDVGSLEWLDDIFVTHKHSDHMDLAMIKNLQERFPDARITAAADAAAALTDTGIKNVQTSPPEGTRFFDSPHEAIKPFMDADPPDEIGVHYLERLSHPGDSHSFKETMPILALPVQAPWGSLVNALRLGLTLRPKYIIPIHDWHWNDEARRKQYQDMKRLFADNDITFLALENGEPVVIDI